MLAQLYICNMDRHNMAEILQLPIPIKSSEGVKDYKLIQLPNGLKALLISDTSYDLNKLEDEQNSNDESNTGLKKSAAGLCIGIYFFSHILYETIYHMPAIISHFIFPIHFLKIYFLKRIFFLKILTLYTIK